MRAHPAPVRCQSVERTRSHCGAKDDDVSVAHGRPAGWQDALGVVVEMQSLVLDRDRRVPKKKDGWMNMRWMLDML